MLCNILSGQLWTAKCFSFLISCLVSFYIMTMIIAHTKVFLSHCHNFTLQNLCFCIIYKKNMILRGCTYFKLQWSSLKSLHFAPDDFTFTVLTRRYKCWSQFYKDWTTSCKISLMSQGNRRDVGHNSNLHSTAQTAHRKYFQVTYWHTSTIFKLWPSQPENNSWKMFNNIIGIWSHLQNYVLQ